MSFAEKYKFILVEWQTMPDGSKELHLPDEPLYAYVCPPDIDCQSRNRHYVHILMDVRFRLEDGSWETCHTSIALVHETCVYDWLVENSEARKRK